MANTSNPIINEEADFARNYRRITNRVRAYDPVTKLLSTETLTILYIAPGSGEISSESWRRSFTWDANGNSTENSGYTRL